MADYETVPKAAIGGLQRGNQAEARRTIYSDARNALIKELRPIVPPPSLAEMSLRRLELEQAIRRVERESVANANRAHIVGSPGGAA
jgi:hypothetical protein